ncbi:MAG TPA: penicillin-binding protein 2 [Candidatus Methanoperedens sp.]|nr:penicillin-binding protein 2 [Candidatus Methanoperedens sp.]
MRRRPPPERRGVRMALEDLGKLQQRVFARRLPLFTVLVAALFALLVLRLYFLQVVRGAHYRRLAEENRISLIRMRAPRGIVYDRHGNVLATNRPSFSVGLDLQAVRDVDATAAAVASALALDAAELARKLRAVEPYRRFEPVRVKEDVDRREVAALEALRYEHPGVLVEVEPRRSYPHGSLASHVLGYVGQISAAELRTRADLGYRSGDHIGKMGIEKELDTDLRGRDGFQQVEVDSLGRGVRVLSGIPAVPGRSVTLTIDLALQQAAEETLAGRAGAVVAIDPRDGAVLAAVSSPPIDSNAFSHGLSQQAWDALNRDPLRPLQNRFAQAQYPPGSVFKIVTAVAALEAGAVTPDTSFSCRGSLRYGNRDFRCWKRGGHGTVSLHRALVESCDVYFYQAGLKAGIDAIARAGRDLGLGRATGLEVLGEAGGLIPDSDWKRRVRGEPWYSGETLSAAIGQGYDLVTPLQAALLTATVANGEAVMRPHLVRRVSEADGAIVREAAPVVERRLSLKPDTLAAVRRALWGVVNEPGGTAAAARVPGLWVAGKTGTAQVVAMPAGERRGGAGRETGDHAWFVCYAPGGTAQVAIAAIVEHAGHGGTESAPLARRMLAELKNLGYFRQDVALLEGAAAGERTP